MNTTTAQTDQPQPHAASFTPGPWTCDAVVSEHPFDICLAYEVIGEGSPIMLASVFSDEGANAFISVDQAKANARLIASAPALLEALQSFANFTMSCAPYEDQKRLEQFVKLKRAARALIVSATSER